MSSATLSALLIILFSGLLLLLLTWRLRRGGTRPALRPVKSYAAINRQVGRAVESGRQLHLALGRGPLTGAANPTSIAALAILNQLAEEGGASGAPPVVTVGDGTLTPAAQDTVRLAYRRADRTDEYPLSSAQFIADNNFPYTYAAGVSETIHRSDSASNLMVGRFGTELAIIAEAADRNGVEQVAGTDDLMALGVAAATTDNLLIGEELFVAGAYLDGDLDQLAGVQVQDILRWLIIATILITAVTRLIVS